MAHPAARVQFGDITVGTILCSLSNLSFNQTTAIENRGLHHTDKRYTKAGGCSFIKGVPTGPIGSIIRNTKAAKIALAGRSLGTKRITVPQYQMNLVIRSLRGQILNPVLRTEHWLSMGKIAERLRRVIVQNNKRFMSMAMNPINIAYLTNYILVG